MATKKDFTQIAHAVFEQATGAVAKKAAPNAKQIAGAMGGAVGGKKRMADMTPEQRHELAMKGVNARKPPASSEAGGVRSTKVSR